MTPSTTHSKQLIDNINEEAIQNSKMQYTIGNVFEKGLIGISVLYAVAFKKLLHMGKHAHVIVDKKYVHKQKHVLE